MGVIIRQSIKGTIVNYVGAFIGFLSTMFIVTSLLSQEVIGLTTVLRDAAMLFSGFAQLGITASAVRFFPYFKDEAKRNNGFFFYLMAVPFVGLLIFIPVLMLLRDPVSEYFEASPLFLEYYNWLIPLVCFLTYWVTFESYASVMLRIAVPKVIRDIVWRLLLIVVYCLYAFGWVDLTGFVTCYVLAYGVSMAIAFFYVSRIAPVSLKRDRTFVGKPLRKNFLSYTSILLIGSLGASIVGKIDIFMLTSVSGLVSTSIYAIAWNMATIVEIPARSISAVSSPLAADALARGDSDKVNRLYKQVSLHQLLIGSMIFLLIWFNIDNIYDIMPNGDNFREGKWVVLFIGIGKLIEVTFSFGSNLISYSRYYHWGLYFVFFISGLAIFTNNWLIPIFGVSGAAIATMISTFVSFSLQQCLIFTKLKSNPFSMGTVKLFVVILLLCGLNVLLPEIRNPWIDGIYRSLVVVPAGVMLIYFFRISDPLNAMADQVWRVALGKIKRK